MRTSLKYFPESPFDGTAEEVVVWMQKWKEDFEAELRLLETQYLRAYPLQNKVDKEVVFVMKKIFEEILGEEGVNKK